MSWIKRIRCVFLRQQLERDLDDELGFHLELKTRENIESGMAPEQARMAALRAFGGPEQKKEECRDADRLRLIEDLAQDTRYAWRQLRRSPGFTLVAVLTLALGIGANTAIFSVIDAALLRPLPYDKPEELVNISTMRLNGNGMVIPPDLKAWQERSGSLDSIGAFGVGFNGYSRGANLTSVGGPARVHVVPVTIGFFEMLGVQPVLGRSFRPEEAQSGRSRIALLSTAVWRRQFGGDRKVLSRTIHLDQAPYTIIGVMPPGLLYPPGDLWVPEVLDASNSPPQSTDWPMLYVIGRLKSGVGLARARSDLELISRRLDSRFSAGRIRARSRQHVEVVPLRQLLAGDVGRLLWILLAAVGFVLLIACANLANLLLARAAARGKEVAVRAALGAGRFRLVRQFLTESVLLASFGGGVGCFIGLWAERAMKQLIPPELPADISLDPRILAFVIGVSALAVILFGLVPALAASRVNVNETLKEGGAGLGRGSHRLRGMLVLAETALSLILLSGAGLLGRSLLRLTAVDLGFDPHHVLLADAYLPVTLVDEPQRQANFFHEALERLRALPGIEEAAAATTHYPVTVFNALATGVLVSGEPPNDPGKPVSIAHVSPDYFRALRIRLLKGRFFDDQDTGKARGVAILNESEARSAFGNRDPLGREISLDGLKGPWRKVVGVIADTRNYALEREPWPEIYLPYQQEPSLVMTFVLRAKGDPAALTAGLRRTIESLDRNQPLSGVATMDEVVQKAVAPLKFKLALIGSFAAMALLLGAIGLYGVISYVVTERTHEIGVRMALGARRSDVLKLVAGQGLKLTLFGVGTGVAGALGLTRFLSSLLYGVKPTDPLTFVAVSLILIAVAFLASYIPARRATRLDPIIALRYE